MEYHGKFGHNIGRIQHIALISRTDICYTACCLATQTVAPIINYLQGIKHRVQYIASNPNKKAFIIIIVMMAQISSYLHGVGIKLNNTQPIFLIIPSIYGSC